MSESARGEEVPAAIASMCSLKARTHLVRPLSLAHVASWIREGASSLSRATISRSSAISRSVSPVFLKSAIRRRLWSARGGESERAVSKAAMAAG